MAFRDFWRGLAIKQKANAAINRLGDTSVGRVFAAGEKSRVAYGQFADLGAQLRTAGETRKTLVEQLKGLAQDSAEYKAVQQQLSDNARTISELRGKRLSAGLSTISGYMTEGDAVQKAARWGLAGAAYFAGAAAIQGGVNQDRRGNPNIAGIPFV